MLPSEYESLEHSAQYLGVLNNVLRPLIPSGAPLAFFDFPNYANVGDSAIWLGQMAFFKAIGSSPIVAVDAKGLIGGVPPPLPEGTVVFINGGGNFGDIYRQHQLLRARVIERYQGHRVVQLPQSIHFESSAKLDECKKMLSPHPDFHLLVRDSQSLELAKKIHAGNSQLCPDMALCIGAFQRTKRAEVPILALLRSDSETAIDSEREPVDDIEYTDWLNEPNSLLKRMVRMVDTGQSRYPKGLQIMYRHKRPLYSALARQRFRRGCDILSRGRVVVTDRLHAHILCTLMGIPHVVLDNHYGKIARFRQVWSTGDDLCTSATTLSDAFATAKALLEA